MVHQQRQRSKRSTRFDRPDHHARSRHQLHRPQHRGPGGITAGPDGRCGSRTKATIPSVRHHHRRNGHQLHRPSISWPARTSPSGPDGALWFTNAGNNSIGRITTAGAVTNYTDIFVSVPGGHHRPVPTARCGSPTLATTRTGSVGSPPRERLPTSTRLSATPSRPGPMARLVDRPLRRPGRTTHHERDLHVVLRSHHQQPYGIVAGPDGALWFTNYSNSIGRISVPSTTPTVPDPPTNVSVSRATHQRG